MSASLLCSVGGCKKLEAGDGGSASAADPSGYVAPPEVASAARGPNGEVVLAGTSPSGSEVRLQQPVGAGFSATASDDGVWSITLPPSATPRMFSLEGDAAGRILHGEGALIALPPPGPAAALARAGFGARVLGAPADRRAALAIEAIDYDGSGGAAVSGATLPRAPIRFLLDGQPVGAGVADDRGGFVVLDLNGRRPFSSGKHVLKIEARIKGETAAVQGRWAASPAADLGEAAFRPIRENGAWRLDWRLPGGGAQTTVLFDRPAGPRS